MSTISFFVCYNFIQDKSMDEVKTFYKQYYLPKVQGVCKYLYDPENDKRSTHNLIMSLHKTKKQLGFESLEELYVKLFDQNVDVCPFCNRHYVKIKFDIVIDDTTNYLNLVYHEPKSYMCQFTDCTSVRKQYNPNSVEFVSRAYKLTKEEAQQYIYNRNSSPFYFHEGDTQEEYSQRQSRTLDFYLNKYGQQEGLLRYNQICENAKVNSSYKGMVETKGKEEADRICKSKAITQDKLISLYGEKEGIKRYNAWLDRLSYTSSDKGKLEMHGQEYLDNYKQRMSYVRTYQGIVETKGKDYADKMIENWKYKSSLEYKEQMYTQEELDAWRKRLATNTLEHYVEKYGPEEGPEKLIEFRENQFAIRYPEIYGGRKGYRVDSAQALEFFKTLENSILQMYPELISSSDIYYADGFDKHEYRIDYFCENKLRWFKLDFCILKLKFNVEFNGEFYHARLNESKEYIDQWNKIHREEDNYETAVQYYYNRKKIVNELHGFTTIEVFNSEVGAQYKVNNVIEQVLAKLKEILDNNADIE